MCVCVYTNDNNYSVLIISKCIFVYLKTWSLPRSIGGSLNLSIACVSKMHPRNHVRRSSLERRVDSLMSGEQISYPHNKTTN